MSTSTFLPVKVGARRYIVDLKGLVSRPLASQRQMQDFSREPTDATLDNQGLWKRGQDDWILGAGQQYMDHLEESDRRRFRYSKGIDVWDRRQLTLLNDTTDAVSTSSSDGFMLNTGTYLYIGMGSAVWRHDGSSWTGCTGLSGTIQGIEHVGTSVFVCTSAGIYKSASLGTAFSSFGSETPDIIGTGGGRLVAGEGAEIYELDNTGTKTAIYTHFDTGFQWRRIIVAPNGIYCFGDDAGKTVGYLLTVVDATGELAPPYPVLTMPNSEYVRDVLFYGGVLVLATSLGVRLANINGSGFLVVGPLIEIGDVECLSTDGRDIWFGWSDYDGATDAGLGRIRPERFTDTFVPAYASDLMVGLAGRVMACANFKGKTYMCHRTGAGLGEVYWEDTANKVASGTFYSGSIVFGTPERKSFQSLEGSWDALPAGATVKIELLDGIGGTPQAGNVTNSTTSSTTEKAELTTALEGEEAEVKVTLSRATDTSVAPVLRRYTLRAMVSPYRSREVILPLIITEQAKHSFDGQEVIEDYDVMDEYEYLLGLMDARSLIDVTIGDRTERMMVDSIGIGPDVQEVGAIGWTKDQDWMNGTWALRLITVEPATA